MLPADRPGNARARHVARQAAVFPLLLYRYAFSPLLPRSCRFEPTCSTYAVGAIMTHGITRGGFLALRRVLRCQPRSDGGYDPVPVRRA